jgi:5-methylthioribose kinase
MVALDDALPTTAHNNKPKGFEMGYKILDSNSILEYVRHYADASKFLDITKVLESTELSDGNLNAVFRVYEKDNPAKSILLKQGLPYLRVAGESWPLSPERAGFEARALAHEYKFAPGLVPEPYWFDETMNINVVEDLREHQVMRKPMIAGVKFENLGETMGQFLAATLFGSSDFGMEAKAKKQLAKHFGNGELCEITEDLVLTEPFEPTLLEGKENRNHFNPLIAKALADLQNDTEVKRNVSHLKHKFMTCGQALLHGDLHTGSIMASGPDVNGQADIRVIDPEFAFFGPMGFDIGLFIANLFLNSAAQHAHAKEDVTRSYYRTYLYKQARESWTVFEADFREKLNSPNSISWTQRDFQNDFMLSVLRDTAGYAGCEMIRRTVGFAHVADLDSIADEKVRAEAETVALNVGQTLIKEHSRVSSYDDIEKIVKAGVGI